MNLSDKIYEIINIPELSDDEVYLATKKILLEHKRVNMQELCTYKIPFNEDIKNTNQLYGMLTLKNVKPIGVKSKLLYKINKGFKPGCDDKEMTSQICKIFGITRKELIVKLKDK